MTALGLQYNLMTAYTSFVAIEEQPVNNEKTLTTVKQPLPLPASVESSAVGFDLEMESEETAFTLHKKIELPADFDLGTKKKVQAAIENKLIPELTAYLLANNITLERSTLR